ncbi:subtilisin-like protein [Trichoderma citrinoviride]|uniref:Subtilisin-like protein n=1 Tax=Trichoderma citrinoviride TaxID=58853 RepID=A0A2T4AYC1_9HYPO|nr:subtilisin-like protein [Trichoderma citrinoviride]PTB62072.1 subtilisin-like protein [Trichoderma citrinoviride]
MSVDDSQGLLQSVLGFFVRRRPEKTARPASLRSRTAEAWLRTEAFLQQEAAESEEPDPEHIARTLRAFEDYVQYNSDGESDSATEQGFGFRHNMPYPKLQAMRNMMEHRSQGPQSYPGTAIRVSKRKRDSDAVIQELSYMEREARKRRVLPREEPNAADNVEEPDADFAVLMRRHLVSLDNALRKHWICVCQKCSGLSVRLSLPQQKKDFSSETSFEVFFGVRSPIETALQEAKITIKDVHNNRMRSASAPTVSDAPEFAHICQSITESLGQRTCLHLALEGGIFQRLRPQPKTFGGEQLSRTVSLSALFKRQQELRGSSSALPLKGKRILAVILATALLPFLETPWLQPSFNHSNILFVEPLQEGELPDITKPFLAMEHIPIISARKTDSGGSTDSSKHMVHPNATVLALGILLCELHYCTPVELMQKDPPEARNVNSDYYTSLDMLKSLEVDAGVDYYLATKACLQWEYYPPGQQADFESVDVQRLFYQNVIKRLEAEIFKSWGLRIQNLGSFDPRQNELCWGSIGQEVVRHQTGKVDVSDSNNGAHAPLPYRSMSDAAPATYSSFHSDVVLRMAGPAQSSGSQLRGHFVEPSMKSLYFFDASHQMGSEKGDPLSQQWMDNLLSSVYHHVDPFDAVDAGSRGFEPVRIAILDSGFDPENPLLMTEDQRLDPRIKDARSFVHGTATHEIRDEIGHGTHALGLLLNVATCAKIYIARIANRETLDRHTYDDIAKARLDLCESRLILLLFQAELTIHTAISNALHSQTLLFAAASNDGANLGRAFPAKYPSVFCIHSTDGNGNPSTFNPTADDKDVNFSLLGEHVSSHWPVGKNGHNEHVKAMSGTSVATPIAAGLAAAILSFVRQQERHMAPGNELLAPWLKDVHHMDEVLKSMVKQRRGAGYDYITPHSLFDRRATREEVYSKIKDIRRHLYD